MSCDLFERDGLLQLERGVPLDPHFDTCPDCREARRVYAQLGDRIAELDIQAEPSSAWKARVWQRIEHRRDRSSIPMGSEPLDALSLGDTTLEGGRSARTAQPIQWRRDRARTPRLWWIAPLAAAAAISLFLIWQRTPPAVIKDPVVSLTAEIYSGQTSVRRGDDAHPGDRLHVTAAVAGYEHAELRVYFNDKQLAAQCSAENPCTRGGNTISMTALMRSLGIYRSVLVVSNRSIPAAVGELDRDAAAALNAGAMVKTGDPIPVR